MTRLFIGGLPFRTTETQIVALLKPFAAVEDVDMVRDSKTKRFRGFCFVEVPDDVAPAVIAGLHGTQFGPGTLTVNEAQSAPEDADTAESPAPHDPEHAHGKTDRHPPAGAPGRGTPPENRRGKVFGHGDRG